MGLQSVWGLGFGVQVYAFDRGLTFGSILFLGSNVEGFFLWFPYTSPVRSEVLCRVSGGLPKGFRPEAAWP